MPVYLDGAPSTHDRFRPAKNRCGVGAEYRESSANCIDIGIVNNMPDGARYATERQFLTLLDAAAQNLEVRVTFYTLPDLPRSESGRRHVTSFYASLQDLWGRQLDGLIVTGTEPRAANLRDEPYWASFIKVVEWAENNTHSTVWSCLAAHGAVLHADGIGRRRLSHKRFGLFECARASDHGLMTGIPSSVLMPHSRWNDLPEGELVKHGYQVLARSAATGVDTFIKQQKKSLFIFFQGHPEYEPNTLVLEYRRDLGRYLRGETESYPETPEGYFESGCQDALAALRERAVHDRREDLLGEFPAALAERSLANTWSSTATLLYGNWLSYLCALKAPSFEEMLDRSEVVRSRELLLDCGFAAGAD